MVKKNNYNAKERNQNKNNNKNNKSKSGYKGKNPRQNNNNNKNTEINKSNTKEELNFEQDNFFNFDGDTNILQKLSGGKRNKRQNNSTSWNYSNVINAESEIRKIKAAKIKEEQNNEMEVDNDDEIKQEDNTKEESEDEDNNNENAINKFDNEVFSKNLSFCDFNLSKLILKGLGSLEYFHPTKVQEKVIPIIMRGADVLVNAETGSGKTATYLLPIIQKIITNKSSSTPVKALILLPTRELAFQCAEMLSSFLKYLEEITFVSICGGMSIENQTNQLKANPDVIIATPGRLIDMLYNHKSINTLENINILVLDEADKLLELGFKDGIMELIAMIKDNTNRQTLLFSATLNPKIIDLGKDTLKNPVKIKMVKSAILTNLKQSIVRMRFKTTTDENSFEQRISYLIHLIKSTPKSRSIIFFNTKVECHKAFIALKSFGINSTELHSDISQPDRLKSLNSFQSGAIPFLLCTDVAARGIDVEKVKCVINFQMPLMDERYIHRIGRTARKGYLGEAITICDDKDRTNLKKLLKKEKFEVSNMKIDNDAIKKYYLEIMSKKGEINQQVENDLIDKELKIAEKDVEKTINMKLHSNEIYNKPKKTWFMDRRQKKELQKKMKAELRK